jgi:hypothetical protein
MPISAINSSWSLKLTQITIKLHYRVLFDPNRHVCTEI